MARYDDQHKRETREGILKHAAKRFRRDGIAAVGVRPLMADAGLTHGGFYAHFGSRADLVAATLEYAAQSKLAYFRDVIEKAPDERKLEILVKTYLHRQHRDQIEAGCAAAALAPEIAREDSETRNRFADQNRGMIRLIAEHLPAGGDDETRMDRAAIIFAAMMGTLQLMRIEADPMIVDRLMRTGRAAAIKLAEEPWPTS